MQRPRKHRAVAQSREEWHLVHSGSRQRAREEGFGKMHVRFWQWLVEHCVGLVQGAHSSRRAGGPLGLNCAKSGVSVAVRRMKERIRMVRFGRLVSAIMAKLYCSVVTDDVGRKCGDAWCGGDVERWHRRAF